MVKMNESAANIKFMECRMKGRQEKFVMQMEYPQCLFQVHEFESTQHYLDTLHQSKSWVHTQVGCRNMALMFNGCMMYYEFGFDLSYLIDDEIKKELYEIHLQQV